MKILFLTYDLPFPLNSGGKIRAHYLIKNLARRHQITLFSYYRSEEQKHYLPEMKKYCQRITLFKRRPPWSWQNIIRSLLTPLPFAAATYYSETLKGALKKELLNNRYDLVHFESFYPALYLPLAQKLGARTLMGNENVEFQLYERYLHSRPFFLRWLLKWEVWRMRLFEEGLWRQADINIAVSAQDAAVVQRVTQKPCPVIPNGVDLEIYPKTVTRNNRQNLIFIGSLIYQQNNDTVKYFLAEIYPLIKQKYPAVKLTLVSGYQPAWLKNYLADTSITFIQDRETPAVAFFKKAAVLVAPMRVAGGTNIKILEAMASGLPVVTTAIGAEGLAVKHGREVIIADQPEAFALAVVELLKDPLRRQALGLAGQALVKKRYDWSKITERLEEVLR